MLKNVFGCMKDFIRTFNSGNKRIDMRHKHKSSFKISFIGKKSVIHKPAASSGFPIRLHDILLKIF